MPTRAPRTHAVAVVAFAAALLTAGCTTGTPPVDSASPASTTAPVVVDDPAQTPAPAETTPAVVPVVGQTFAKGQEPEFLMPGEFLYELYDVKGDYTGAVLFAAGQPLPAPVQEAIVAPVKVAFDEATALGVGTIGDGLATDAQAAAEDAITPKAMARAVSASKATGRHIVLVYSYYGAVGQVWAAIGDGTQVVGSGSQSRETTISRAQAWVAKQADPTSYEIVVSQ